MADQQRTPATYQTPTVTDFGKVSVVTAAIGMTFQNDSAFTGSMEFPGMSMTS